MADVRSIIYQHGVANTPAIQSSANVLPANIDRGGWAIQNLGTNTLYVNLGGTASTAVFHVALKAGTTNDDGTGGSFSQMEGTVFIGAITIAGTGPRYTIIEM